MKHSINEKVNSMYFICTYIVLKKVKESVTHAQTHIYTLMAAPLAPTLNHQ